MVAVLMLFSLLMFVSAVQVSAQSSSPLICTLTSDPGWAGLFSDSGYFMVDEFGNRIDFPDPSLFELVFQEEFDYGVGFLFNNSQIGLLYPVENCIGGRINDGRINNRPLDVGASFAAYCGEEGDINIWDIDGATGNGTLDFTVSNQQLVDGQAQAAANGAPVQVASSPTTGNTAWASEHSFALIGPNINPGEPDYQFNFDSNPCV